MSRRLERPASVQRKQSTASSFKQALVHVPVPTELREGVHVLRVHANGKTQKSFLTLSEDKFTLYVTSQKVEKIKANTGGGFWRRGSSRWDDTNERAIDIGAIDRIQRGQVTHKFELARKNRPDLSSPRSISSASASSVSSTTPAVHDSMVFLNPTKSFSILFRGERTLDLIMVGEYDRDRILNALDEVLRAYQSAKQTVANEVLMLRYVWLDVVSSSNSTNQSPPSTSTSHNTLNVNEIAKLMERINFGMMKKNEIRAAYEKFASILELDRSQKRKGLTFEQTCTFLHKIRRDTWEVKPVNVIWEELFGGFMNNHKPRTNVSENSFLERFMHEKQQETNVTLKQVKELFWRLHQLEIATVAGDSSNCTRLDKNRFEAYLLGPENDAFDPMRERFDQRSMTKPISEYWINTSHNTYLTGDQFTSHSSIEMYLNCLYRGCRCLELDIWDGEFSSESGAPIPVVWHGHTMTTKILFVDIIKAIKIYLNFNPSVFPIVLSFENHCSIPYQQVMAEQLVKILGDRLYIPTEASLDGRLPSPQDLRGMVVIKGRRPDGTVPADVDDSDDDTDDEGKPDEPEKPRPPPKIKKQGIAVELARLTLFHGCKHQNWETSTRNRTYYMHSFVESKVRSMCRQRKRRAWAIYNQSHMTRTFPAGSRVDSSNYCPLLAWSAGCQLVALNFQTPDAHMRLNDGRFRENGGCGYVLKPSSLMMEDDYSASIRVPIQMSVRVLSGSCLPKSKGQKSGDCMEPYVKISVFDVKNQDKETCTMFTTEPKPGNGFFPIWMTEPYLFNVENAAVAMLQLSVHDRQAKDEFIASASIPVTCLREGYRSVQLFDANNTRSGAFDFASLLIEVIKQQVVAEI